MNKKRQIATNVMVGVVSQIISFALGFVSRTFFLRYIGVEILGLSGTLTSIVSTLSLVDLGFYSAVIYRLYAPLTNQNYKECNEILAVLKRFYFIVAGIITLLFVIIAPFLKYLLNGVEITNFVYFVYVLICANTVVSYFVAYKRTLLYADGKDSIAKLTDSFCNICFTGIKIYVIAITGNFLLFQLLAIFQTLSSNIILHFFCTRYYKWLQHESINKNVFKLILGDAKNVFAGKLAGYVYSATDNLVISTLLKTIMVGFYSNYIMLQSSLRLLGSTIVSQIAPFIGKKYTENNDRFIHEQLLEKCSFGLFVVAAMFVAPLFLLADEFIKWWLGETYILPYIIIFLCLDLYIELQQSAFCLYLGAAGLFAEDKKICIIGACVNITMSLILVKIVGLIGVIMGTVCSQFVFWFLRCKCILKGLFKSRFSYIIKYILINFLYFCSLIITILILKRILAHVLINNFILQFISKGIVTELVLLGMIAICFGWTKPFRYCVNTVLRKNK